MPTPSEWTTADDSYMRRRVYDLFDRGMDTADVADALEYDFSMVNEFRATWEATTTVEYECLDCHTAEWDAVQDGSARCPRCDGANVRPWDDNE